MCFNYKLSYSLALVISHPFYFSTTNPLGRISHELSLSSPLVEINVPPSDMILIFAGDYFITNDFPSVTRPKHGARFLCNAADAVKSLPPSCADAI